MRDTTKRTKLFCCIGVALILSAGCAARKEPLTPKLAKDFDQLDSQLDLLPPFPEPSPESGSLWADGGPGAALMRDTRAFRVNDLLTVELQESSAGSNQSTTDLKRSTEYNFAAPYLFGLENIDRALETDSESSFSGDGSTARKSALVGTITARVLRVLPNGDLIIAGQKTVMVNREHQVLTLVGSVRPVDVSRRNRVYSSDVGNLTVRMWGNGEVDDTVRQGWFMRIMNRLWPF